MHCLSCGSLFPRRFPSEETLGEAYRAYYTTAAPSGLPRRWLRRLADLTRGAYMARSLPATARRVLDYGCGSGEYLAHIAAARPDLAAFGTDRAAPAHFVGTLRWIDLEQIVACQPFDWITLGHVIEHLAQPSVVLARLATLLTDEGAIWLATPNAASFLFSAAGPWARDVDFPRHRQIFSRDGLTRLLGAANLEVCFESPPRLNAVMNSLSTLGIIFRDGGLSAPAKAAKALAVCRALASHVFTLAERRDRESPELVAVCRLRRAGVSIGQASCDEAAGFAEETR